MAKSSEQNPPESKWIIRLRAVKRLILWHGFSGSLPLYLVAEFPKSGGTWFSRMLAECLEIPFPDPWSNHRFESCVLRGHHLYNRRFRNTVAVFRDGRDVVISSYYFFLFPAEGNLKYSVEDSRRRLRFADYDDLRTNLPRFIEYLFCEYPRVGWSNCFSWSQFVDSWLDKAVAQVKYEELLAAPHQTLARAVKQLVGREIPSERLDQIVQSYSFESMTGRKRGNEQRTAFARKGVAGDWKNHFSAEAREVFDAYAGQQLIALGYENNRQWVHDPQPVGAESQGDRSVLSDRCKKTDIGQCT